MDFEVVYGEWRKVCYNIMFRKVNVYFVVRYCCGIVNCIKLVVEEFVFGEERKSCLELM